MEPWEERFSVVAARHEGLIARFHLPDIGSGPDDWWRAIRSDRWVRASSRVLRAVAAPCTDAQRVLAAVLDASPGGFLHHGSALAWLGMEAFDLRTLDVARMRGISGNRVELGQLHELRAVRSQDVIVYRGVPCETALRAIWSEAARYSSKRRFAIGLMKIGRLLDNAHRDDLVSWAALHEMVEDIHQRGRAGTVLMRELAGARPPGSSPTESRNESKFEEILDEGSRRGFQRQVVIGGDRPIGRSDYRDEQLPLAVEINSLRYHSTLSDQTADERRYHLMNDAAFMVGVVWDTDLWSNRGAVLATVDEARRLAARGERGVLHSPGCPWPNPYRGTLPPPR